MERYASGLNMSMLLTVAHALPTTIDDGNVDMAYHQGSHQSLLNLHPLLQEAVDEIARITKCSPVSIMVNTLQPHTRSPIHTDAGLDVIRYHLPVKTNLHSYWHSPPNFKFHMELGFWYGPVPFSLPHAVYNDGSSLRTHIIVDLNLKPLVPK